MRENLNSSVQIPQAQWFIRSNSIAIIKMNTIEREPKNSNGTETPPKKPLFLPPRVMFLDSGKHAPRLHHEVRCRLAKLTLLNGRSDTSKAQRNESPTKTWPTLIMLMCIRRRSSYKVINYLTPICFFSYFIRICQSV